MQEGKTSKLNTNNMELSEVSIAKVAVLPSLPKGKRNPSPCETLNRCITIR